MTRAGRWPGVAGLVLVAGLGGCAQSEALLADRGNRYCLQAGGLGAAGGALAGAALGRAVAGPRNNSGAMLAGAVIGGVAGAIAGCRYGIWVADRRAGYETARARLEAEGGNVRRTNESLAQVNLQLRQGLEDRRKALAKASAEARGSAERVELREALARTLEQDEKGAREQLQAAERELEVHRRTLAELRGQRQPVDPAELARYQVQVREMERSVAELGQLTRQYAAASGQVAQL